MVVQGQAVVKGHDSDAILDQIARFQSRPAQATIHLERDGEDVKIALAPVGKGSGPSEIYVVEFVPSEEVAIEAGENAGSTLTYTNIVTDWQSVGRWDGTTAVSLRYEGAGKGPLAIIVQRAHMGPVLTAAKLD